MSRSDPAYQERLDYLYSRLNYERLGMPRSPSELGLGRMRRLLKKLGDPQDALKIIHITGTKGKGSTSALLAAALTASGHRTGLFTSPHLTRLEERFQVDGREASPAEMIALTDSVREAATALDAEDPRFSERETTFFEITTAMGLLHFVRSSAETVVLEVGLGGRLDATNAVRPCLTVLTTISFDHTRLLGTTLAAIAREKAGILKRRCPAVIGITEAEPLAEIRSIARARQVPAHELGRDFLFDLFPPRPPITRPSAGTFHARTWRTDWGVLPVPLLGAHQAHNATLALASLDALAEQGLEIGRESVARGFENVTWPARAELLGESPWIVIDGAHNVASAEALAETLKVNFPPGPRTLVFGTTREKDVAGQLRALLPHFDRVIGTRYLENPRSTPLEELAELIPQLSDIPFQIADDPAEALALARAGTPPGGLICVTGSLFLAGEVRNLFYPEPTTQPGLQAKA